MKAFLPPALILSTLVLLTLPATSFAAVPVASLDATAAGTVSLAVVDLSTSEVLCTTQAAVALEAGSTAGVLTWQAAGCGDDGNGAALFTLQCSDACFPACYLPTFWSPDEVRCSDDAFLLDESWYDDLTLLRDGTFTFTRDHWATEAPYRVEARGVLLVAAWPAQ